LNSFQSEEEIIEEIEEIEEVEEEVEVEETEESIQQQEETELVTWHDLSQSLDQEDDELIDGQFQAICTETQLDEEYSQTETELAFNQLSDDAESESQQVASPEPKEDEPIRPVEVPRVTASGPSFQDVPEEVKTESSVAQVKKAYGMSHSVSQSVTDFVYVRQPQPAATEPEPVQPSTASKLTQGPEPKDEKPAENPTGPKASHLISFFNKLSQQKAAAVQLTKKSGRPTPQVPEEQVKPEQVQTSEAKPEEQVEVVHTVVEQPLVPEVLESQQPSDSDDRTVQNTRTDSAGVAARLISYYNKLTMHSMAQLQEEKLKEKKSMDETSVQSDSESEEELEYAEYSAENEEEYRSHEQHGGTYETELVVPADCPFFNETLQTELTVSAECQCGDQGLHHVVESDEEESTSFRYERYDYAQHSSLTESRHVQHSAAAQSGELVHCSCDGFEPFDLLSECIDTDRLKSSEYTYQREELTETKVRETTRQQRGRAGPVSIKFHLKVNKHCCSTQSTTVSSRTDASQVNLVWQPKAKKHSCVSD